MNVGFDSKTLFSFHFFYVLDQRISGTGKDKIFIGKSQAGTKVILAVAYKCHMREANPFLGTLVNVGLENLTFAEVYCTQRTVFLYVVHLDLQPTILVELGRIGEDAPYRVLHPVEVEDVTDKDRIRVGYDDGIRLVSVKAAQQFLHPRRKANFAHAIEDLLRRRLILMQVSANNKLCVTCDIEFIMQFNARCIYCTEILLP